MLVAGTSFERSRLAGPENPETKEGSLEDLYFEKLKDYIPEHEIHKHRSIKAAAEMIKGMSEKKQVHSMSVSLYVARVSPDASTIIAGLLHDVKERDPKTYKKGKSQLDKESRVLVKALSSDDKKSKKKIKNEPLEHMREVLPGLSRRERNRAILIKLCDRLDNLNKRLDEGGISKSYMKKSKDLFKYLASQYQPDGEFNELEFMSLGEELAGIILSRNYLERRVAVAA